MALTNYNHTPRGATSLPKGLIFAPHLRINCYFRLWNCKTMTNLSFKDKKWKFSHKKCKKYYKFAPPLTLMDSLTWHLGTKMSQNICSHGLHWFWWHLNSWTYILVLRIFIHHLLDPLCHVHREGWGHGPCSTIPEPLRFSLCLLLLVFTVAIFFFLLLLFDFFFNFLFMLVRGIFGFRLVLLEWRLSGQRRFECCLSLPPHWHYSSGLECRA